MGLGLDAARSRARRDTASADQLVQQVQGEVRDCVGEVRRIIDGRRPPALDERGLVGALDHQAQILTRRRPDVGIEVAAAQLPALPAAVEVVAYLIAQEALTNAIRHAQAGRITIGLSVTDGDLLVEIVDDGVGMPEASERPRDGVRLPSMSARAEEIGGRADVESAIPQPTEAPALA